MIAGAESAARSGARPAHERRILLVDDDGPLRQSLAEQLRLHEEFGTAEADSGAAAIDLCKTQRYDLILLDVGLPDMDGRENIDAAWVYREPSAAAANIKDMIAFWRGVEVQP